MAAAMRHRVGMPFRLTGAGMNESVLGKLADRLAGNGQALCAWVTMNEPAVAEALAPGGLRSALNPGHLTGLRLVRGGDLAGDLRQDEAA